MVKQELVIIVDYSKDATLTLMELCEICHVPPDFIHDLIEDQIIHPRGATPDEWIFDLHQLQRVKTVLRLQHDLEINVAGIAVVLELLDELEELRARMELIEKHYL